MKIINNFILDLKKNLNSGSLFSIKNTFYYILIIILLIIAYIIFNKYIYPKIRSDFVMNKELIPHEKNKNNLITDAATVFFFKTEWCPYCNSSKREWNNFKRYVKNLNETREEEDIITAIEIDCDSQEDICSKYNVETFPTIKIIHRNKEYIYDSKPETSLLIEFLNNIITKK